MFCTYKTHILNIINISKLCRMSILESMAYIAGTASPFIAGALLNVSSSTVVYAVSGQCHMI